MPRGRVERPLPTVCQTSRRATRRQLSLGKSNILLPYPHILCVVWSSITPPDSLLPWRFAIHPLDQGPLQLFVLVHHFCFIGIDLKTPPLKVSHFGRAASRYLLAYRCHPWPLSIPSLSSLLLLRRADVAPRGFVCFLSNPAQLICVHVDPVISTSTYPGDTSVSGWYTRQNSNRDWSPPGVQSRHVCTLTPPGGRAKSCLVSSVRMVGPCRLELQTSTVSR